MTALEMFFYFSMFLDYLSPVPLAPPRAGDRFSSYFCSNEKEMGLVKTKIYKGKYPARNMLSTAREGSLVSKNSSIFYDATFLSKAMELGIYHQRGSA